MIEVILQFIPLAVASFAPGMIVMIISLLNSKNGLGKSLAFLVGRVLCYAIWGLLFLGLTDELASFGDKGEPPTTVLLIQIIIGGLLLILVVKSYLSETDPDAPPPKWMTMFDDIGNGKLFGLGFLLSVVQLRFVMLMLVGTSYITSAQLLSIQVTILLIILVLLMIWPQLLPLIVYLGMRDRADAMLVSMNGWLTRNQRAVNVVILGLIGLVVLWDGLSTLLTS